MINGWKTEKLKDICLIKGRIGYRGYTKRDLVDKGKGAITLSPSNINSNKLFFNNCTYISWFKYDESPEIKVYKGDIIYCKTASIGKLALVDDLPEKATINPQFVVLKEFKCLNKYLYYFMNSNDFKAQINTIISGTAVPTLSQENFGKILVPIATPQEQKRIVTVLDEAFADIDKAKANAEKNLQNAKELFESYLSAVFSSKEDKWEKDALENLVHENCTLSYGIVQPGEEYANGLPLIRPTDLTKKFVTLSGLKRINPKLADGYTRTKLIGDELLLCVRGTTGITCFASRELEGANVTRGIVPIRFNSKMISQDFGYYLLISDFIQRQIKAKTYGAALMQINISDLRKLQVLYPTLTEQRNIVKALDKLSTETKRLEEIYQQKIDDLEELKKSILGKAFSGELTNKRVPELV